MDKNTIIGLKRKGKSNRWIAREYPVNRKTVAKYWCEYKKLTQELQSEVDSRKIQEQIVSPPKYDGSTRKQKKYTPEIDTAIDALLESEVEKARELGDSHKQKLTNRQIHGLVVAQGFDIGLTSVTTRLKEKRDRKAEAFIRQEYDFGDRLEYDFGEVRLVIGGKVGQYYLAVFGSPSASFKWAYLYRSQKKEVFLDSHVRFFEMVHGVYREVVYDNMRNVVVKFIGRNEKELNADLIAMSTYYGFTPNVTNCFRGNEKGFVESSVKSVRKDVFAVRYRFDNIDEAEAYLEEELSRINEGSLIEDEMKSLLPWRPPLEFSRIVDHRVDKYSFVRVDNNFYSVPEYLVGRNVTARVYVDEIVVYSGLNEVCRHKKKDGSGEMSVNIFHYLDTLAKKPGAVRNSKALRSEAEMKAVFDSYYTARAREFVSILRTNQDRPLDEVMCELRASGEGYTQANLEVIGANVLRHTNTQLYLISDFFMKGGALNGHKGTDKAATACVHRP
jgi:transposase